MDKNILNFPVDKLANRQVDSREITFTQITTSPGLHLTKRFDLSPDGSLIKSPADGLGKGNYTTLHIASMDEYPAILNATKHNQAHLYGVCEEMPSGKIVPEALRRPEIPSEKSRTKEFFDYPNGPGIIACDVDVPKNGIPYSKKQVVDALVSVFPLLRTTCVIHAYSASSDIYDEVTGEQLLGPRGQRIYFSILIGRDIPRVFSVMFARLFLAGYGRFEISEAGSLLERSLIDKALATPTQPDYCGGAACGPGVEQRRPPAESLWHGEPLVSSIAFPDLTPDEQRQYDEMRRADRERMAQAAAEVRHQWFINRADEFIPVLLKRNGLSANKSKDIDSARTEAVRVLTKALNYDTLEGDFVLRLKDGTTATVRDVLRRRDQFHGQICFDPLEPDYDGGRLVGILYLDGKTPKLHSQAHGGKTYFLAKHRVKIRCAQGELAECIEDTLTALRDEPRIFSLGPAIVEIKENGLPDPFKASTMLQFIGREYRYYRDGVDSEGNPVEVLVNPPPLIGKTIIELGESCKLKKLNTVLTIPTMLPDGRLLMSPGFDEKTGVFLQINPDDWPTITVAPSLAEMQKAYEQFFKPLSQYPWKDPLSKGVALSMLLTAITRAGMRIAPGFAVQASLQSSGKTFAIQAAAALISGENPPVTSIDEAGIGSDSELRKALISVALAGKKEYLIDNVLGYFENSALAAYMTGGMIEGRILGQSRMSGSLPFNIFLGISGNNLQLGPDL